jgi:hypothetical protein
MRAVRYLRYDVHSEMGGIKNICCLVSPQRSIQLPLFSTCWNASVLLANTVRLDRVDNGLVARKKDVQD